jgi:hypothetical protein
MGVRFEQEGQARLGVQVDDPAEGLFEAGEGVG